MGKNLIYVVVVGDSVTSRKRYASELQLWLTQSPTTRHLPLVITSAHYGLQVELLGSASAVIGKSKLIATHPRVQAIQLTEPAKLAPTVRKSRPIQQTGPKTRGSRQDVFNVFFDHPQPLAQYDVGSTLGINPHAARQTILRLMDEGLVEDAPKPRHSRRRHYQLAQHARFRSPYSSTPLKRGHVPLLWGKRSKVRQKIVSLLMGAETPLSTSDITELSGTSSNNVRDALSRGMEYRLVELAGIGSHQVYALTPAGYEAAILFLSTTISYAVIIRALRADRIAELDALVRSLETHREVQVTLVTDP